MGGGGGLTGKRQRERVGEAAEEAAPLVQCVLGEVRVGKGMVKGQVVIRLAEVVACRWRKQAKRVGRVGVLLGRQQQVQAYDNGDYWLPANKERFTKVENIPCDAA